MLIEFEKNLMAAMADVYEELCYLQETRDPDPLRAPYELVTDLIEATLLDDIENRGTIYGGEYTDDLDMSKLLYLMYTDQITQDEMNTIIQRGMRKRITDYVMTELYDYIEDNAGE